MCQQGRLEGAVRIGRDWAIPMPPVVIEPKMAHRRQGRITDTMPEFLGKRLPKARP